MDDRVKIFDQLKDRQVKVPVLKCKPGNGCWCEKVHYKFEIPIDSQTCMSPAEMLKAGKDILGQSDIRYLKSLLHMQFDSTGE